jgi:DDE superfamily endonuclease
MTKILAASCIGWRPSRSGTAPEFDAKLADIVGLYLDPPEGELVLCVNEKTQAQALNRSQSAPPMWSRTHDYACYQRHIHVESIAFLESLAKHYPKLELHLVCDNYGTHKHPAVPQWLAAHPRLHLQFTPTSASLFNLVERWFTRHGSFDSVRRPERTITRYLADWNESAQPFRWIKTSTQIKRSAHNAKPIYGSEH